jgi:hypothetical protein
MKVTRARLSYRLRMSPEQRSIVGNEWRLTPACRLVIVFLAILAGCDSPQSPSTSKPLVLVIGRVIDYTNNVGLANVEIVFGAEHLATDQTGRFELSVPVGIYGVWVMGRYVEIRARGTHTRGDVLVNGGACTIRYGVIREVRTAAPIEGAKVLNAMSGSDGWYQTPCDRPGVGTASITATHPKCDPQTLQTGRAEDFTGVQRRDVDMVCAR